MVAPLIVAGGTALRSGTALAGRTVAGAGRAGGTALKTAGRKTARTRPSALTKAGRKKPFGFRDGAKKNQAISQLSNNFGNRPQSSQNESLMEEQDYANQQAEQLQATRLNQITETPGSPNWLLENQQTNEAIENEPAEVDQEQQEESLQNSQENQRNQASLADKSKEALDPAIDLVKKKIKKRILWAVLSTFISLWWLWLIIILIIIVAVPTTCAYKRGFAANAWSMGTGWWSGEGAWTKLVMDSLSGCSLGGNSSLRVPDRVD